MKVLCFGGTFNPLHHAHQICARSVAEAAGFERIVLIPTAQSPHKVAGPDRASFADRLQMCQLGTAGNGLFEVNDIEGRRTGPSYTIDTARALSQMGWGKIHCLIGADMLLNLPKWHQPTELLQEVEFVVMARPGWSLDWDTLPAEFRHLRENVVEAPLIQISSTDIRRRVAAGLGIEYLTPEPVQRYIHDHGLYR